MDRSAEVRDLMELLVDWAAAIKHNDDQDVIDKMTTLIEQKLDKLSQPA